MSIHWDTVLAHAEIAAHSYSDKFKDPVQYSIARNAYFTGYLENASERESLRVINENLRKEVEALKAHQNSEGRTHVTLEDQKRDAANEAAFDDLSGLI
jgi:hypothetical protein